MHDCVQGAYVLPVTYHDGDNNDADDDDDDRGQIMTTMVSLDMLLNMA